MGVYNYSATRDDQGKKLEESFSKWQLKGLFETASTNREKLLTEQIAIIGKLEDVRRDAYVRTLATGRDPKEQTVERQLNWLSKVSGADASLGSLPVDDELLADRLKFRKTRSTPVADWLNDYQTVLTSRTSLAQNVAPEFARAGLEIPGCDDVGKQGKSSAAVEIWLAANKQTLAGARLAPAYTKLQQDCVSINQTTKRLGEAKFVGKLLAIRTRLDSERAEYSSLKSATSADRAAADAAINDRNKAVVAAKAAAASGDATAEEKETDNIRLAAVKIQALLTNIKKAEDVFSVEYISDKAQDSLDEFLSTIIDTKEGETPKADSNKAAMALVLFPDLMRDAQKKLDEADAVSLAPLVMQKQLAQIAKDSASKDIAVRTKRIALLEQAEALLQQQARMFVELDFLVAGVPDILVKKYPKQYPDPKKLAPISPAVLELPMAEVLATRDGMLKNDQGKTYATATQENRSKVWRAAITYIDEGTRRHKDIVTIDLTLDLLSQQTSLSYSEANVMQWNALVSAKVEQLALFGKTGLKAEQYSALVNNLMLFWIGLRIPQ
jgi:hypothetical protein